MKGSSPLTRGKLRGAVLPPDHDGLIPTHAGKTDALQNRMSSSGAHPHSRGENSGKLRYSRVVEGSSPLTRGKQG